VNNRTTTRLNKYLAHAAGYSRREADELISAGKVHINGEKAVMGAQVRSTDEVMINGKPVQTSSNYTYLLFNKPVGYVCSRRAQGNAPTIYDILPEKYRSLKTVGRLDRDSSGLIILTDDGDFSHRMTHPSFRKTKTYEVALDHPLEPLHQQIITDRGVQLRDGVSKFMVTKEAGDYVVSMHEGRNRQIRRTFAALGYTVTKLHRTTFGPYRLDGLSEGEIKIFVLK